LGKAELVLNGSRWLAAVGCLSPSILPIYHFVDFAVATPMFSFIDFNFFMLSVFAGLIVLAKLPSPVNHENLSQSVFNIT
jgi:hypothetical protein